MFKIKTSDGIMEITMIPSLEEKLTEERFERLIVMKVGFYELAHGGLPSSSDIQTFIDDIITDFNKEE